MEFTPIDDLNAEVARLEADGYTLEWEPQDRDGEVDDVLACARKEALSPEEEPKGPIVAWLQAVGLRVAGRMVLIVGVAGKLYRTDPIGVAACPGETPW